MENKNDLSDGVLRNRYTGYIYDLYEAMINSNKQHEAPKKKFLKRNKNSQQNELEYQLERIEKVKNNILKTVPGFYDLWDFCEFVRVLEKIFFFPNSTDNELCVEFDMLGKSKESKLRIKREGYEIRLTLIQPDALLYPNKIDIIVIRNYGHKMENHYTITNGRIDYKLDISDIYLIHEINLILIKIIYNTFSHAVELIKNNIPQKGKSEEQLNYELYEKFGFY